MQTPSRLLISVNASCKKFLNMQQCPVRCPFDAKHIRIIITIGSIVEKCLRVKLSIERVKVAAFSH